MISVLVAFAMAAAGAPVSGIDRSDLYLPMLQGKRIGLVVNQASVNAYGVHSIDSLLGQGLQIKKLFALEHGIRGEGGAGETIPDSHDPTTGIPIVSLYGVHKKPTPEMLKDLDVVVYDIQDVGVRFYTYISSLGLIMEACAQAKLPVVVFDRANPNGDYIAGPVLKKNNLSFVGAYPIPLVYGMTVGELAGMIHARGWKKTAGLKLKVIPMLGYERGDFFFPSVWPSSGLKNPKAIRTYPSMALFEPSVMNYGGGTPYPFLQYCYPDSRLGPYSYIPIRQHPKQEPRHEGQVCYGEKFFDLPIEELPQFTTKFFTDALSKIQVKDFVKDLRFFRLLVGDDQVADMMLAGKPHSQIEKTYALSLQKFKQDRKKFLLYRDVPNLR